MNSGISQLLWVAGMAAALVVLTALANLDIAALADWRVWTLGIAVQMVRATARALLDALKP